MIALSWRVICTVLTMLYAFVAMGSCAVPQQERQVDLLQGDVPQEQVVTLNILQSRGEISQALQEAADLFLTGREGVSIRIQTAQGRSSCGATLRAKLLAGEQVDLFHIFGYRDVLELGDSLEDLSGLPWATETYPFALEAVTLENGIYGIPYSVEAVGLLVNREIFEAAGLPVGMASFDEMEESFKTLREQITLGELQEAFPNLETVTELPGQSTAFLGEQMGELALGEEFASASQAAAAPSVLLAGGDALGGYIDLLARYASHGRQWPRLAKITQNIQVEEGLAPGRVAVIQQSTEVLSSVRAANPEIARQLRLQPIPLPQTGQGEEEEANPGVIYAYVPAYWAVNKNASPQAKALAEEFLAWLYQSESGATVLASRFGAVSPYRETALEADLPAYRQMLSYLDQGMFRPRYYREFPAGWGERVAEALREYFTQREQPWDAVTEEMRQSWWELGGQP